jgi:hypothetical protein
LLLVLGAAVRAASPTFLEFTMIRAETTGNPSSQTPRRIVLEAQRADGSKTSGEVTGDSDLPPRRFVSLVSERKRVQVDDRLGSITTLYLAGPSPVHPVAIDPQCGFSRLLAQVKPVLLGNGEALGFKTIGLQTETVIGDESFLGHEWRAPDLDCAVLKFTEVRRNSKGETTGEFHLDVTKVTLGPPHPQLFTIPPGYAEQSPSQMQRAVQHHFGGAQRPMPESMRKRLEREDQEYFANHQAFTQ